MSVLQCWTPIPPPLNSWALPSSVTSPGFFYLCPQTTLPQAGCTESPLLHCQSATQKIAEFYSRGYKRSKKLEKIYHTVLEVIWNWHQHSWVSSAIAVTEKPLTLFPQISVSLHFPPVLTAQIYFFQNTKQTTLSSSNSSSVTRSCNRPLQSPEAHQVFS